MLSRDIDFREAYSSDSGRAMQTAQIILQEHQNHQNIPYLTDKRIREWCFGSLDGGYDGELWGVVPRILAFKSYEDMMTTKITYRELANAIIEADTADWAEPYEVIRDRVWSGFEDIAHHREKNGGGKVMVFCRCLINHDNWIFIIIIAGLKRTTIQDLAPFIFQ